MTSEIIDITHQVQRRWLATVTYKTDSGPREVEMAFNEFYELGDLIEHGPDWNCTVEIAVRLNPHRRTGNHTVEDAEQL